MSPLFKPKPPFTRQDLAFPQQKLQSRTGFIKWKRLENCGDVGALVARAMVACNDLETIQFLNRHIMFMTIELDEDRLDAEEYGGLTMHNLMMHRRWVFRMACVSLDDLEQFFNRLLKQRSVARIRDRLHVKAAIRRVKDTRKTGDMRWIKGLRNTSAAHISDMDAFKEAIEACSNASTKGVGKYELSTKHYAHRFHLADDIVSKMSVGTAWGIAGASDADVETIRILTWVSEFAKALFYFFQMFTQEAIHEYELST